MYPLSKLLLFLAFCALPLHAGGLPPVIYVMDFDASKATVSLGQDQPVTQVFTDIAAMTLSNDLVKQLASVVPAQRITKMSQARAPGWLLTGTFQSITLVNSITVTGYYKMQMTAVLTDLSSPDKPLGTFPADSAYYKGNESNEDAGDSGGAPQMSSGQPKSAGDQIAKGITIDTTRAAKRIVEQIKRWLNGV